LRHHRIHFTAAFFILFVSFLFGQTTERTSALEQAYKLIEKDPAGAVKEFRIAQKLFYSDTIALQIAYLLNSIGHTNESIEAFTQLTSCSIPEFRERAHSALIVLDELRRTQRNPATLHLSATALNDSYFQDNILWSTLQGAYNLTDTRNLSAVITLGLSADTRSVGGTLPVLYSDNVLVFISGFRYSPLAGAVFDVEGGIAYDLRIQGNRSRLRWDYRAVGSYGTGVYLTPKYCEKLYFEHSFFADAGVSAGFYSRYDNVIGYAQGRAGIRLIEYGASAFDAYLRTNLSMDSQNLFYNNIGEAGGGVRFIPDHKWGVSVLLEFLRGTYIGSSRFQSTGDRYHSTIRLMGVIDRFF